MKNNQELLNLDFIKNQITKIKTEITKLNLFLENSQVKSINQEIFFKYKILLEKELKIYLELLNDLKKCNNITLALAKLDDEYYPYQKIRNFHKLLNFLCFLLAILIDKNLNNLFPPIIINKLEEDLINLTRLISYFLAFFSVLDTNIKDQNLNLKIKEYKIKERKLMHETYMNDIFKEYNLKNLTNVKEDLINLKKEISNVLINLLKQRFLELASKEDTLRKQIVKK